MAAPPGAVNKHRDQQRLTRRPPKRCRCALRTAGPFSASRPGPSTGHGTADRDRWRGFTSTLTLALASASDPIHSAGFYAAGVRWAVQRFRLTAYSTTSPANRPARPPCRLHQYLGGDQLPHDFIRIAANFDRWSRFIFRADGDAWWALSPGRCAAPQPGIRQQTSSTLPARGEQDLPVSWDISAGRGQAPDRAWTQRRGQPGLHSGKWDHLPASNYLQAYQCTLQTDATMKFATAGPWPLKATGLYETHCVQDKVAPMAWEVPA